MGEDGKFKLQSNLDKCNLDKGNNLDKCNFFILFFLFSGFLDNCNDFFEKKTFFGDFGAVFCGKIGCFPSFGLFSDAQT